MSDPAAQTAPPESGAAGPRPFVPILVERRLATVFQPVFDARSGNVYGFEALTRDKSAPHGSFPAELAESMRAAGRAAEFNLACARSAVAAFLALDLPGRLLINFDPPTLTAATVDALDRTMRTGGDAPLWPRVVIEVTESARSDPAPLAEAMDALRRRGARIALDDFGEGFASLRLWSEVRPQLVKIDRHFCKGIDADPYKVEFVSSLMRLASRLGILAIAEGVETAAELLALSRLGVRLVQGYLTGRPDTRPARRLDDELRRVATAGAAAPGPTHDDRIARLCEPETSIPPSETVDQAYARFEADRSLRMLPVVDAGTPLGLIERARLTEFLAQRFRRELFGRRSVLNAVDRPPLVLEEDTRITDAARLLADKDDGALDAGIVVTGGGAYLGVVHGRTLMRAVADRQLQDARQANPLTQLPGNALVDREIDANLEAGRPFRLAWIDVDHFKPFNDTYGYAAGDQVLCLLARLLVNQAHAENDFVGHVGGDDFVLVLVSDDWRARLERVVRQFGEDVLEHFGDEERRLCSFAGRDRDGFPRRFGLLTLSVGVLSVPRACPMSKSELMRTEARAKEAAKRQPGSAIVVVEALATDALATDATDSLGTDAFAPMSAAR